MGVADQADPLGLELHALGGLIDREHVLPDRVAGRGVEDRHPGRAAGGESGRSISIVSAAAFSIVQRTASAAAAEKEEMSSSPSTARSWLPIRQVSQRSRTSSAHASGWAP